VLPSACSKSGVGVAAAGASPGRRGVVSDADMLAEVMLVMR